MNFYRFTLADLITELILLPLRPIARWYYRESPKPPHYGNTTYVVKRHFINGEEPMEVGRTTDYGAALELAEKVKMTENFDPFFKEARIHVE